MKKTYGLPALLSFIIPGLGQLIKGHVLAAIAFWFAFGFLFFNDFPMRGVLIVFLWIANIYNAYNYPRKEDIADKTN